MHPACFPAEPRHSCLSAATAVPSISRAVFGWLGSALQVFQAAAFYCDHTLYYVRNLEIRGHFFPDFSLFTMLLCLWALQRDHYRHNSSMWPIFFTLVRTVCWRTRSSPCSGICPPVCLWKKPTVDFVSVELYLSVYKHIISNLLSQIMSIIPESF